MEIILNKSKAAFGGEPVDRFCIKHSKRKSWAHLAVLFSEAEVDIVLFRGLVSIWGSGTTSLIYEVNGEGRQP